MPEPLDQLNAAVSAMGTAWLARDAAVQAMQDRVAWLESEVARLTKPVEPPPVIVVGPSTITLREDTLEAELAKGKSDVTYLLLVPQTVQSYLRSRGNNVTVKSGLTVRAPVNVVAPYGKWHGVYVHGKDFLADRLAFTGNLTTFTDDKKDCPAFAVRPEPGSSGVVRGCTGRHLDDFVHFDAGHLGWGIFDCDAHGRGYGVWLDGSGVIVKGCKFQSDIEHPLRMDAGPDGKATTSHVLIDTCELVQAAHRTKEPLAFRKGQATVLNTLMRIGDLGEPVKLGYGRLGRDAADTAPLSVTFKGCRFVNHYLDIKGLNPTDVRFESSSFAGVINQNMPPIRAGGRSRVTVRKDVTWDKPGDVWVSNGGSVTVENV